MTKPTNAIVKRFQNATTFYEQLKLALEYHAEPDILRDYSPLAKPYFLNQQLEVEQNEQHADRSYLLRDGDLHWGIVLQQRLSDAAALLWHETAPTDVDTLFAAVDEETATRGRGARYDYLILELNYFKQLYTPAPKTQAEIYNDILHISRTSHDRWLKEAVEHLGQLLLRQLRPPLRLELPTLHSPLIGREEVQALIMETLGDAGSVTITGASGMGKSSLGTAILDAWSTPTVFWFTVRLGLNDHLNSLLFALGYFFYQQGASALWLQLIADEGKLEDLNLALGLVRADIEALPTVPLLCFDEIDLLRAADIDRPNQAHLQLLNFIESLRPHLALLMIGQRAVLESDLTVALDRLTRRDIEAWLQRLQIPFDGKVVEQLTRYTAGNPRLITLCLTLHQLNRSRTSAISDPLSTDPVSTAAAGTELQTTLMQLPTTPAIAPIWDRLRSRLSAAERQLLQMLAVFRTPAPQDAWQHVDSQAQPVLLQLQERHLLYHDDQGGVWVLPILRDTLYDEMAVETREACHLAAAHMYAARGDYTEAAYHFQRGDQPARAIETWYPERRREIQRGQAGAALAIVEEISANRLQRAQQKQLALLRSELYGLLGEPGKVVNTLAAVEWSQEEPESVEAFRLWGEALNVQGDAVGAQEKLQEGVQVVAYLLEQHAHLHVQRGLIHLQQREMKAAWQEATRARYFAENLQGAVQANLGNYESARDHYAVARELATELDDTQAAARTEYYLGIAAMQQQDLESAFAHYRAAIADYQRTGNRAQEVYARSNLAAAYLTAGDYAAAINEAKQALVFCERMNAPYWMAMNAANLAEAYFELGQLEPAEQYALQVIEHEEVDSYPYALYTLGSVRRQQQRHDEAFQLYTQSCRVAERNEDRFLLAYAQRALGEVHRAQGNGEAAAAALQQALTLFQQLGIQTEIEATEVLLRG